MTFVTLSAERLTNFINGSNLARETLQIPSPWNSTSCRALNDCFPQVDALKTEVQDGLLFLNDTFSNSRVSDTYLADMLNQRCNSSIRVLGRADLVVPLIPTLRTYVSDPAVRFVMPGGGASNFLSVLRECDPEFAEAIAARAIAITPLRTLTTTGVATCTLNSGDRARLASSKGRLVVMDDVIASGGTLSEIAYAVGRPLDAVVMSLGYRAQKEASSAMARAFLNYSKITAAVATKMFDNSIPPINTVETLSRSDDKGSRARERLNKYFDGADVQKILESGAKLTAELLRLAEKNVVFCDIDGVLGDTLDPNFEASIKALRDRLQADPDCVLILNSDSPTELVRRTATLLGASGIFLSERGSIVGFGEAENIVVLEQTAVDEFSLLRTRLFDRLRAYEYANSVRIVAQASEKIRSGDLSEDFLPEPSSREVYAINGDRTCSLGIYAPVINCWGRVESRNTPSDRNGLIPLERAVAAEVEAVSDFGFDINVYPDVGSVLVRRSDLTKSRGVSWLLNQCESLGVTVSAIMIGDSADDYIQDSRVRSIAVANARTALKDRAVLVTDGSGQDGVCEVLDSASRVGV